MGRWLSEDPIGFEGGLNFYAYVDGQVVNAVDPHGLQLTIPMPQQPGWMPDWAWDWFKPSASDVMIGGPLGAVGPRAAAPSLRACKIALRKVHEMVGKL